MEQDSFSRHFLLLWTTMGGALGARKHQKRKIQGSRFALGFHFEGSWQSRRLSNGLWKRFQTCIAEKVYFWRMPQTKSLLLEAHGRCKTWPKPGTTDDLSSKYSNFYLDHEKLVIKTTNSKIIQMHSYLLCFKAHTMFWKSLWGPLLRPSWRLKELREASWKWL